MQELPPGRRISLGSVNFPPVSPDRRDGGPQSCERYTKLKAVATGEQDSRGSVALLSCNRLVEVVIGRDRHGGPNIVGACAIKLGFVAAFSEADVRNVDWVRGLVTEEPGVRCPYFAGASGILLRPRRQRAKATYPFIDVYIRTRREGE